MAVIRGLVMVKPSTRQARLTRTDILGAFIVFRGGLHALVCCRFTIALTFIDMYVELL